MNLPRLRELAKAGKDGSIRPEELKELFAVLSSILEFAEQAHRLIDSWKLTASHSLTIGSAYRDCLKDCAKQLQKLLDAR
jgi:hypothetical protein